MQVQVINDFSIILLRPLDEAAKEWFAEHLSEDGPMLGSAYAVEPRYVGPILEGFQADGGEAV